MDSDLIYSTQHMCVICCCRCHYLDISFYGMPTPFSLSFSLFSHHLFGVDDGACHPHDFEMAHKTRFKRKAVKARSEI
jgi:hypothetical protein